MASRGHDTGSYWRANLRLVLVLLVIWFVVAYLGGIVFADALNRLPLGGFKLGFWIAQQGSIIVFVLLILVYAWAMGRLDRRYAVEEEEGAEAPAQRPPTRTRTVTTEDAGSEDGDRQP